MGICQQKHFAGAVVTGIILLHSPPSDAGLIVDRLGTAFRVGFDDFRGRGFSSSPEAGQLDSRTWRVTGLSQGNGVFGGDHISGDFARGTSTGGVTTGGIYGFDVDSGPGENWALGFQPIGSDLTPGAATLKLINQTQRQIDRLEISFNLLNLNNGGRASLVSFASSFDDMSYFERSDASAFSAGPSEPSPTWRSLARSVSLAGMELANGLPFFLQWRLDDFAGTGSRDEWALDDIEVTAWSVSVPTRPVPEPSGIAMISGLLSLLGARRYLTARLQRTRQQGDFAASKC